jgi:hypothetical protein
MAVKKIPVPFCDWCGFPFLPKFRLPDGTHNPIFDHPEKSKRCGKCKRTGWNAGGVDRRRKMPLSLQPLAIGTGVELPPLPDGMEDGVPPPRTAATQPQDGAPAPDKTAPAPAPRARRCKHGLFTCKKCDGEQAA